MSTDRSGSIGDEIRAARKGADLTIAEVADRAKLRVAVLQAIENDDLVDAVEKLRPEVSTGRLHDQLFHLPVRRHNFSGSRSAVSHSRSAPEGLTL